MQPANTSKIDMFGPDAPVWKFLNQFGGAADPFGPRTESLVFETYPVLTMIALDWLLADERPTGRLPKYNPQRRKTFSITDWQYLCGQLLEEFDRRDLSGLSAWIREVETKQSPSKGDQDRLDACICLLVALYLIACKECLMVGGTEMGYIVVPYGDCLHRELEERCRNTERDPAQWVRSFILNDVQK